MQRCVPAGQLGTPAARHAAQRFVAPRGVYQGLETLAEPAAHEYRSDTCCLLAEAPPIVPADCGIRSRDARGKHGGRGGPCLVEEVAPPWGSSFRPRAWRLPGRGGRDLMSQCIAQRSKCGSATAAAATAAAAAAASPHTLTERPVAPHLCRVRQTDACRTRAGRRGGMPGCGRRHPDCAGAVVSRDARTSSAHGPVLAGAALQMGAGSNLVLRRLQDSDRHAAAGRVEVATGV